ncbi:DinB family protein [Jeotgalibacillus sp. ET6]|uniref:DinB family protein n=1 Tax=Jeotgalibacillus sp. ET6 TaxID=3037260 RepID=UPI00241887EF|nr:DinB family protein [Jeotgalibacillus sp. ET6]MDG5473285.1 DinB family protein [Jeotgalibacillus sp. ET6]
MISLPDWFSYHIWGTARQLTHLQELPETVWTKQIQSVFPTIQAVFEHVWLVDSSWLKRMQGEEKPGVDPIALPDVETAVQEFNSLHQQMMTYIKNVEDPAVVHTFRTMKGIQMKNSIEEMVYTVVNHGSYHRGNVTAMHRQLGFEGKPYDYIYYLEELRESKEQSEKQ